MWRRKLPGGGGKKTRIYSSGALCLCPYYDVTVCRTFDTFFTFFVETFLLSPLIIFTFSPYYNSSITLLY
jgi:hypothetical protein